MTSGLSIIVYIETFVLDTDVHSKEIGVVLMQDNYHIVFIIKDYKALQQGKTCHVSLQERIVSYTFSQQNSDIANAFEPFYHCTDIESYTLQQTWLSKYNYETNYKIILNPSPKIM